MRKKREEISCSYVTVMNSFSNTRMDKIWFINWRLMHLHKFAFSGNGIITWLCLVKPISGMMIWTLNCLNCYCYLLTGDGLVRYFPSCENECSMLSHTFPGLLFCAQRAIFSSVDVDSRKGRWPTVSVFIFHE